MQVRASFVACDFAHAQLPAQHYAHAQIYIFGRGGGTLAGLEYEMCGSSHITREITCFYSIMIKRRARQHVRHRS